MEKKKKNTIGAVVEKIGAPLDPIAQLHDPNNTDNIVLYNEKDQPVEFIQIAIIPYKKKEYAILQPAKPMKGVGDDQAIVFEVVKGKKGSEGSLHIVSDDEIIDACFVEYNKLRDKAEK
jgi:hypothetical protein